MRFINQFPADIQQAFYDAEELKLMPFGKYTGRTLHDVFQIDPQYLGWCLQQDWFRVKFGSFFDDRYYGALHLQC